MYSQHGHKNYPEHRVHRGVCPSIQKETRDMIQGSSVLRGFQFHFISATKLTVLSLVVFLLSTFFFFGSKMLFFTTDHHNVENMQSHEVLDEVSLLSLLKQLRKIYYWNFALFLKIHFLSVFTDHAVTQQTTSGTLFQYKISEIHCYSVLGILHHLIYGRVIPWQVLDCQVMLKEIPWCRDAPCVPSRDSNRSLSFN